jgi:MarR family transcriptional regulator for hemolysin
MENLQDILFYTLENSIKAYRQFAQRQITSNGYNITVDQWLVLKTIEENPDQTQHQVAEKVFKDVASLTRIIELLVNKGYLERAPHGNDRRRFKVALTTPAKDLLARIQPVIEHNRTTALQGLSAGQSEQLRQMLGSIIHNCKS